MNELGPIGATAPAFPLAASAIAGGERSRRCWCRWNPIMNEPLRIENGMANVGGATGTGIAWKKRAVEECSV